MLIPIGKQDLLEQAVRQSRLLLLVLDETGKVLLAEGGGIEGLDFDPGAVMDRKMARRMSRFIHFAMAAATEAVDHAGLKFEDWPVERRDRTAVVINTGGGGMEQVIEGTATLNDTQVADLLAGKWYANIHTAANPGGELRGNMVK